MRIAVVTASVVLVMWGTSLAPVSAAAPVSTKPVIAAHGATVPRSATENPETELQGAHDLGRIGTGPRRDRAVVVSSDGARRYVVLHGTSSKAVKATKIGKKRSDEHAVIRASQGRPVKVLEPTYLFHGIRVPMGACAIMAHGKPEVLACNAPVLRAQARVAAQTAQAAAVWQRRERQAAPWAAGGAVLIIGFVLGRWTERRRANLRARKAAQQEAGGTWARKVFGVPQ